MSPERGALRGAGGESGGKGGSGAQRTPTEAVDSLVSTAYARVLDVICEGEIEGLQGGLKGVYLDGVPVVNPNDSPNFRDVTAYDVPGTQGQEYIPGFSAAEAETVVNVEVKEGLPAIRTVRDAEVDAVRVTVQVPQLTYQHPETGDLQPFTVKLAIDVQSNGGGWVEQDLQGAGVIRGKCTSPYERAYRIELYGSPPWDIRVRRTTPDANTVALQNRTFWKSYTTVLDEKLSFPNTALVALQVSAKQFGSVPARSYRIRGLKVRVPSNYNPQTREYSGTWDGTFHVAWTDNPAWCLYDLLTTKRYGLGRYLDESQVDKWGLYTVARYCDELVPDGKGGQEPRFTCNLYLQTQADAYQVVSNLASVFRGLVYWASGAVYVAQDAPRDAEYLFTPANVVDGLFTYSGTSRRARHTVALVTWNDPANHYKAAVEYVADEDGLRDYGYNPTDVVALGCTSRGQAQRVGRWLLHTERLETETVVFRTGLEGALRNPGAVVKVADPTRAGRRWGGRVVEASDSRVELDSDVHLEAGHTYSLSVVLPDGKVEERPVAPLAPAPYRALTLATPFSAAPVPQAVWVLAANDLVPTPWRVLSVAEVEPHVYEVTALAHHPGKYAAVEQGVQLQPLPTSALPSSSPPQGLALGEGLYKTTNGGLKVSLNARWTQHPGATAYVVRWRLSEGNWSSEERVETHYWELQDIPPGPYRVQVATVLGGGFVTSFAESAHTVLGKAAPPSDVAGFAYALNGNTATLRWVEIPDLDRDMYELRHGGGSWETASLIAKVRATSFEWALPFVGVSVVRLKAVDSSGNYSTHAASVSVVSTPTVPSFITMTVSDEPPP
ncbi:phage tail protein [Myxococcus sp. K38C18041901]|uniref:host specificity protein J n=1 Tax=Myxococcus guangdongensis TaxID=2906760 RepID=UPI0020A80B7C|nr:phage tail protein [Myxococcus guangdongensis]MCP3065785.1 phage tail protein [Myxococcus guangdongensis]